MNATNVTFSAASTLLDLGTRLSRRSIRLIKRWARKSTSLHDEVLFSAHEIEPERAVTGTVIERRSERMKGIMFFWITARTDLVLFSHVKDAAVAYKAIEVATKALHSRDKRRQCRAGIDRAVNKLAAYATILGAIIAAIILYLTLKAR